jgi:hypothetical protein
MASEYFGIGECCRETERLADAKKYYLKAQSLWSKCFGAGNLATARCRERLGVCEQLAGHWQQSYDHYSAALAVYKGKMVQAHPERLALEGNLKYVSRQLADSSLANLQKKANVKGYDEDIIPELRRTVELLRKAEMTDEYSVWNAELQRILATTTPAPRKGKAARTR